jgi:hypothetical protein
LITNVNALALKNNSFTKRYHFYIYLKIEVDHWVKSTNYLDFNESTSLWARMKSISVEKYNIMTNFNL